MPDLLAFGILVRQRFMGKVRFRADRADDTIAGVRPTEREWSAASFSCEFIQLRHTQPLRKARVDLWRRCVVP